MTGRVRPAVIAAVVAFGTSLAVVVALTSGDDNDEFDRCVADRGSVIVFEDANMGKACIERTPDDHQR